MKTANAELVQLLHNSDTFFMADLFTFTLASGKVARYTDADMPVRWLGNAYDARSLIIKRGRTKMSLKLEADSNELEITADPSHKLEGLPWPEAAMGGVLDGARVLIERLFFSNWDNPVGAVTVFSGRVSDVSASRGTVEVAVKSDIELLNVNFPRNVYQAGCSRTLYSPSCGVDKARFTVTGTVEVGSTKTRINSSIKRHGLGWFEQGVVEFLTGANAGLTRTVLAYDAGRFEFSLRLPHIPQAGDTFKAWPGCNKTKDQCDNKFGNIVHFRGFPFIPASNVK